MSQAPTLTALVFGPGNGRGFRALIDIETGDVFEADTRDASIAGAEAERVRRLHDNPERASALGFFE